MTKYNYFFITATDDVGELTAELVEKMEHFKVGQEKVSALKTVAIKLEVSYKRINSYRCLKLTMTDPVLGLELWSPQSLLPSDISTVSNEETERGGVKAGLSGHGCSLGQVSPFYFFFFPLLTSHLTLTPVVGLLAKNYLKISSSKIRSKIEEKKN